MNVRKQLPILFQLLSSTTSPGFIFKPSFRSALKHVYFIVKSRRDFGARRRTVLGECHCWWTKESPKAYVAKFYGRLRLICSVLRASNFPCLKCIAIVILWVYWTLYFRLTLLWHFLHHFSYLKILCLAKVTDEGSVPEMRIRSISNLIRFKMVYTS